MGLGLQGSKFMAEGFLLEPYQRSTINHSSNREAKDPNNKNEALGYALGTSCSQRALKKVKTILTPMLFFSVEPQDNTGFIRGEEFGGYTARIPTLGSSRSLLGLVSAEFRVPGSSQALYHPEMLDATPPGAGALTLRANKHH